MGTLDLFSRYILTNAYTLASKQLASNGDQLFMDSAAISDSHKWYLTSTDLPSYYRLHTVANGDTESLDVLNDNGTSSKSLRFYQTGLYTGQYWSLDDWGDGTFRLSNNFTGPEMHLDTYSDTFEPFLGDGEHTGQHWSFSSVDGASSTSSSSSSPLSTLSSATDSATPSASPTTSTSILTKPSSAPAAGTNSHGNSLSVGAIVGIAVGGLLALTVCICAVIFFLRSKRISGHANAAGDAGNPPSYYAAQEKGANALVQQPVQGGVQPQTGEYHAPAELGGGVVQTPVEMPGQRY